MVKVLSFIGQKKILLLFLKQQLITNSLQNRTDRSAHLNAPISAQPVHFDTWTALIFFKALMAWVKEKKKFYYKKSNTTKKVNLKKCSDTEALQIRLFLYVFPT